MEFSLPLLLLYLPLTMMVMWLFAPYLSPVTRGDMLLLTSVFRPAAIICFAVHVITTLLMPLMAGILLALSAVAVVGAIAMVALELRSMRQPVAQRWLWMTLIGMAVLLLLLQGLRSREIVLGGRVLIAMVVLVCMSGWVAVETWRNRRARIARYMNWVIVLILSFMAFSVVRIYLVTLDTGKIIINPHEESLSLVLIRAGMASSLGLICLLLNNYYLETLWHRELRSRKSLESQFLTTLNQLAATRDNETGNHILRTRSFVKLLAENLRRHGKGGGEITDPYIDQLYEAAPLHDIGKIGIPDEILLKPARLTPPEWEIMKTHARIGEEVLSATEHEGHLPESQLALLRIAKEIAGGHHERWDGSGYPRGLSGMQIPLAARLMSVADNYDALTNVRPYKQAWSHKEAVAEIVCRRGTSFDPDIVDAFLEEQENFRRIAEELRD